MNSSSCGSLTLRTISAPPQTSSAVERTSAPACEKRSSGSAEPSPAPDSTRTRWPARTSSRTPSGVAATRYSLSLTSRGTPTITNAPPRSRPQEAYRRGRRRGTGASAAPGGRFVVPLVLPGGEQDREDGLHVLELARRRLLHGPGERHAHDLDALFAATAGDRRRVGPVEMEAFVGHPGRGQERAERTDVARLMARLLDELADGAVARGLALHVEEPSGNLERGSAQRRAELADEEDVSLGRNRHDGARAGMADDLPVAGRPSLDLESEVPAVERFPRRGGSGPVLRR